MSGKYHFFPYFLSNLLSTVIFSILAFHLIMIFLTFFLLELRSHLVIFAFMIVQYLHVDLFYHFLLIPNLFATDWLEKRTFCKLGVRCVLWFTAQRSSIRILNPVTMSKESLNVFWRVLSCVNTWWFDWLWHLFIIFDIYIYSIGQFYNTSSHGNK